MSAIAITPDDNYLYSSDMSNNNVINMYSIESNTGKLSPVESVSISTDTHWPSDMAISPSGKLLYVISSWKSSDDVMGNGTPEQTFSMFNLKL